MTQAPDRAAREVIHTLVHPGVEPPGVTEDYYGTQKRSKFPFHYPATLRGFTDDSANGEKNSRPDGAGLAGSEGSRRWITKYFSGDKGWGEGGWEENWG